MREKLLTCAVLTQELMNAEWPAELLALPDFAVEKTRKRVIGDKREEGRWEREREKQANRHLTLSSVRSLLSFALSFSRSPSLLPSFSLSHSHSYRHGRAAVPWVSS